MIIIIEKLYKLSLNSSYDNKQIYIIINFRMFCIEFYRQTFAHIKGLFKRRNLIFT